MSSVDKVLISFLYIEGKRPVFVFENAQDAAEFAKGVKGAEIYDTQTHVFVPKPHGLQSVRAAATGQFGYMFHTAEQAQAWSKKLGQYATMTLDGTQYPNTVFAGRNRVLGSA